MVNQPFAVGEDEFAGYRRIFSLGNHFIFCTHVENVFISNRESNPNRVGLDNAGKRLGWSIDVVSFGYQSLTDVAGERRFNLGVAHIDFSQFQIGFGLFYRGLGLQKVAFWGVKRGFGSVVLAA